MSTKEPEPGNAPVTEPAPVAGAPAAGQPLPQIPNVTLHHEIARGGMGVVYRGRQDFLERDVAVKLLAPHLHGERFAARFRREAKILAGIKHPHIVACHMAGTTNSGQSYLVMEFVDGPSLKQWIGEHGALPLRAALGLARQLASALGCAAEAGVIHRDVKPENILLESPTSTSLDLSFPFVAKLVDLGLARMTHETGEFGLTSPGAVVGTPATMAPEQFDTPDAVDFRADIYGLGCVLYQMLTGEPAFASTKLTEVVVAKRDRRSPNPCVRCADVPPAVGRLVTKMLASDPADRPASYRKLTAELDELLAAAPRAMPAASTAAPAGSDPAKNERLLQTAEFEFLAAGAACSTKAAEFADPETGREAKDGPHRASRVRATSTRPGGSVADARRPWPATPRPPARLPAVPARARARRRVIVAAVAAVLGLGAVPFLGRTPDARPPASAPTPRPGVAILAPDGNVRPRVPIELRALPAGALGTPPQYRWTAQPEGSATFTSPLQAATTLQLEGLPGDEFTVGVEVSSGRGAPIRAERKLTLAYEPADLFADFLANNTTWMARGRARGDWARRNDGAVTCTALDLPCLRSRSILGATWRLSGQLLPVPGDKRPFGQAAVCLRLGPNQQLAVVCERSGTAGERWCVSVQEGEREDHRPMAGFRQLDTPKAVFAIDRSGTLPAAEFTVTRRGNVIDFRIGLVGIGEVAEHHDHLRTPTEDVPLVLFARGGRAVFSKLELW